MPNTGLQFIGDGGAGVQANIVQKSGAVINTNYATAPRIPGLAFMGTAGDGLFIQRTAADGTVTFQQKTVTNGLGANFVSSIFVDYDAVVWAGTYDPNDPNAGGLSVSRDFGQTWETIRINGVYDPLGRNRNPFLTGLKTNYIRDIKRDRLTNKLVIATNDGVYSTRVIPNNVLPLAIEDSQPLNDTILFSFFSALNGLGSNNIYTVTVEEVTVKTARVDEPTIRTIWWAGTTSGMSRSTDQGTTWKTFDLSYLPQDIDGPVLTFLIPNNDAGVPVLAGITQITIAANDATAVKTVEISFDNQNFTPIDLVGGNFITSFDTRSLPNGRAFLYARGTDTFGNVSNAVPLILNINNDPPASILTVTIEEPMQNARIADIFPVKLRVVSDVEITSVEMTDQPAGPPDPAFFPAKLVVPPRLIAGSLTMFESFYEFMYDTTSLDTGQRVTLTARATDQNGRQDDATRAGAPKKVSVIIFNRLPNVQAVAVSGHTIWSGTTNQCGLTLSQDNGKTWKFFTTADGLSSNNIISLAIRKNEVWVGTDNGLNMSPDMGRTWKAFSEAADNLPGRFVLSIAFQGPAIWVGTTTGAGRMPQLGLPFTIFRVTEGISDNQVNNVFVDCNQTCVWLATNNGISFTKNAGLNWKIFRTATNGLPSNMVSTIVRYGGKITAATDNGLGVSADEGQSFIRIAAPVIADDMVMCLRVDGSDLWIGTVNGLTKRDAQDRFVTYKREGVFSSIGQQLSSMNIGLKSNVINFIAQ